MRISTTIFLTDETISPVRLARELEQRGFGGLYLPEHTHIPVARDTDYPAGGELPREYGRTLDPFVALGQAAAVTERLALGTGVTLITEHDPIALAKQIATLDHVSGGRFTLGLGFGWNKEEAADHGVDWRTRRDLGRDRLNLMRALWAPEPTAYEGGFGHSVRASEAWPKPHGRRAPHPPGRRGGPEALRPDRRADGRLDADRRPRPDGVAPGPQGGLGTGGPRPEDPGDRPVRGPPDPGQARPLRGTGLRGGRAPASPADEAEVLRVLDGYAEYL